MLRIGICDDEREALESRMELVRHIMQQMGMNADINETEGILVLWEDRSGGTGSVTEKALVFEDT